jgi:hypothetical protein
MVVAAFSLLFKLSYFLPEPISLSVVSGISLQGSWFMLPYHFVILGSNMLLQFSLSF